MTLATVPEVGTWYVRGPNDAHVYDRKVPILTSGDAFCQTCLTVHACPVGNEWHIEGPGVDRMLCGMVIDEDDGEVRDAKPKNVCKRCRDVQEAEE